MAERPAASVALKPVDALRGFSILLVLLYHWAQEYPDSLAGFRQAIPPRLFLLLFDQGYFGVRIFFVISGFLITWTTIQRYGSLAKVDPLAFYLYRLARIGPPLLVLVAGLSYLGYSGYPYLGTGNLQFPLSMAILYALTFRENLFLTDFAGGAQQWAVLWSLSIEGIFYLVFPILCVFLRTRALLVAMLVLGIIGPVHRWTSADLWPYGYHPLFDDLSCLDGIALGAIVALAAADRRIMAPVARFRWAIFFAATGALLAALALGDLNALVAWPSYVGVAAAFMLLPTPVIDRWTRVDLPLRWLGIISYELYLTHYVILGFMRGAFEEHKDAIAPHTGLWFLVYAPMALVTAGAMHFLVAIPGRRLVGRLARAVERSRWSTIAMAKAGIR